MDKNKDPKNLPTQATAVPYDSNYVPVAVAVEAVPVSSGSYGQQQQQQQYPQAVQQPYGQPQQQYPQVVQGQGGFVDIGTCRRCGQQFQRAPGANNASAEFYRCPRCARLHLEDFCLIS